MKRRFEVLVTLKDGLLDPQGKTVEDALPRMGWTDVSAVRVGKLVEMTVEAGSEDAARSRAQDVATHLLANPVIEDVRILSMEEAT